MAEKYTLTQAIASTSNVTRLADRPGGFYSPDGFNQFPLVSAREKPIAVADFNKDGNFDLLTGGSYYIDYGFTRRYEGITTLYLGDADGRFENPQSYHVGSENQFVGDFDKDGNLDVLIVGEFYLYSQKATLLPGEGNGGFGKAIDSEIIKDSSLFLSELLAVADYNHDGNADIILQAPSYESPEVRVSFGDGVGKFGLIESQSEAIPTPPIAQPITDPLTGTKVDGKIVGSQVDVSPQVTNQRDNFRIGSGQPFVSQHNRIGNFVSGQDNLVLSNATFDLLEGFSFARAKNPGKAKRSAADLVYVRGIGKLFYNENQEQKGFGKGGLIADLADGLNLRKSDIQLSLG